MIELNFYCLALVPFALSILYVLFSWLQKPQQCQRISSLVPSLTKTFWSEMKVSWDLGMKHPKDLLPFYLDIFKKYGPVVHFNLAGRSYVVLNDPDDLKILLSSTVHIDKGPEYRMLNPWLNDGLLLSTGKKWQNRRRLFTNSFHFKTLSLYNPSINKHSRILAKKLLETSVDNNEVSIMKYITLCSLDIMCETIMGSEINAQEGKSVEYVHSIKIACRSVVDRVFKFWLWNDLIYRISETGRLFYKSIKILHDYTDNVIQNKKALLKSSKNENLQNENINYKKIKTKSFLDLVLDVLDENSEQMIDQDIRGEVDTFLFEGHDTSSIAMTMTFIMLGMHQDVQDRVREELECIFDGSDRDVSMEDLNEMKYLDAVIKEVLRLYPSVPGITRELKYPLQIKNYTLPPMTVITVLPYVLHRNEEIFPNSEEFIPERFLDEENKSKFLFTYLPFSAGTRNCIGQKYAMYQIKTVVSTVLRKLKIETLGNKEDIQISMQLTLRIDKLPNVKFYKI